MSDFVLITATRKRKLAARILPVFWFSSNMFTLLVAMRRAGGNIEHLERDRLKKKRRRSCTWGLPRDQPCYYSGLASKDYAAYISLLIFSRRCLTVRAWIFWKEMFRLSCDFDSEIRLLQYYIQKYFGNRITPALVLSLLSYKIPSALVDSTAKSQNE